MLQLLQLVTLLLVAVAWALMFAHVAELPGKRRLDRATYFAVQRIYYPGFTIAGISEPLSIVALAVLLFATTAGDPAFGGIVVALAAAIAAHAVYWLMTHPVNKVWLEDEALGKAGSAFFGSGGQASAASWLSYRDRWEYSHLIRAGLFSVALVALIVTLIE